MYIKAMLIVLLSLEIPGIFGRPIDIHEYSLRTLVEREVSGSTTNNL
jgi:hypothetical protein